MLLARGRILMAQALAVAARRTPGVVAAGAVMSGLIAIAAGVWAIDRSAGLIVTGVVLIGCAAGWYRGSGQ